MSLVVGTVKILTQPQTCLLLVEEIGVSVVLPRNSASQLSVANLSKVDLTVRKVKLDTQHKVLDSLHPIMGYLLLEQLPSIRDSVQNTYCADSVSVADDFIPVGLVQPLIGLSGLSLSISSVCVLYTGENRPSRILLEDLNLKQRSKLKFSRNRITEWGKETKVGLKSVAVYSGTSTDPLFSLASTEVRQSVDLRKNVGNTLLTQNSRTRCELGEVTLSIGKGLVELLTTVHNLSQILTTYNSQVYSTAMTFYLKHMQKIDTSAKIDKGLLIAAIESLLSNASTLPTSSSSGKSFKPFEDFFEVNSHTVLSTPGVAATYFGLKPTPAVKMEVSGFRLEQSPQRFRLDLEKIRLLDQNSQDYGQVEFLRVSTVETGPNEHCKFCLTQTRWKVEEPGLL